MNEILVSVVIPMFNREDSIARAVNSVFEQEGIDKLVEVIIVDDGSSDDSVNIVESLEDSRVKIIKQTNSGAPTARNLGISASQGKFVALLDADDYFLPGHLSRSINLIESSTFDGVYSKILVDRGDSVNFEKPPRGISLDEDMGEYLLCDRGFVQTSTLVLRSSVAKSVTYLESLKGGQDTDYAMRLFFNGYKLGFVDQPGAVWSDHFNSNRISAKINFVNRIDWLNSNREMFTNKAYYADFGWFVAKGLFRGGCKLKALYYFFRAFLYRCYSLKLSVVIFLQIILSDRAYRKLSDILAGIGFRP